MEFCEMNLAHFIEGKWNVDPVTKLPRLTDNMSYSVKVGQIWDVVEGITCGLTFIHSEMEIHRDLKPRNGTSLI